MISFFKKLLLITISAAIVFILLVFGIYFATKDVYADNYQKGFVYQYRRLQNSDDNTPKVIVFGGSYLTFSLDTKKMEEYLNEPCYELGVQTNMGKCYTIELLSEEINEGDTIVFPFEYFSRDDYGMDLICLTLDGQADMTLDFLKNHPKELLMAIPKATYIRVAGLIRNQFVNPETVYTASAFNQEYAYYDMDRPAPTITLEEAKSRTYAYDMNDIDSSCFELLNEFNELCEEKGAQLLITYAPICEQSVYTDEVGREEYMDAMDEALDAEIICSLDDCFYDYKYIFNGISHFNSLGQQQYTKDLAEMIEPYL